MAYISLMLSLMRANLCSHTIIRLALLHVSENLMKETFLPLDIIIDLKITGCGETKVQDKGLIKNIYRFVVIKVWIFTIN